MNGPKIRITFKCKLTLLLHFAYKSEVTTKSEITTERCP